MQWTHEAVESLKRLAREGLSASVIAATLGAESRNAVIGKASRIGIRLGGGRASGSALPGAPARRARPAALPIQPAYGDEASLPPCEPETRPRWPVRDAEVGEMRRLRLEDILESACRWPLGDPRSGDFCYCGLATVEGRSYCDGHCRVAYRAPNARAPRSDDAQRSTRRRAGSWG